MVSKDPDQIEVERLIAKGAVRVTRCPSAYCAPVSHPEPAGLHEAPSREPVKQKPGVDNWAGAPHDGRFLKQTRSRQVLSAHYRKHRLADVL